MPKKSSFVKFHDGQYQFKVPFVMYADFEAVLKPIESPEPNPESPYTKVINHHIPSGFCVNSEFAYGKVENLLKLYRGEDCIEVFCDYISNEARGFYHMFPETPMKPLTCEQWRKFNRAKKCHIYLKGFKEDAVVALGHRPNPKVRYHCHYTGKYQGPAHRTCNLRYKIPNCIPVVFHNLNRYDAQLFVQELGKKFDTGKIGVIAENQEKYISFDVDVIVHM